MLIPATRCWPPNAPAGYLAGSWCWVRTSTPTTSLPRTTEVSCGCGSRWPRRLSPARLRLVAATDTRSSTPDRPVSAVGVADDDAYQHRGGADDQRHRRQSGDGDAVPGSRYRDAVRRGRRHLVCGASPCPLAAGATSHRLRPSWAPVGWSVVWRTGPPSARTSATRPRRPTRPSDPRTTRDQGQQPHLKGR